MAIRVAQKRGPEIGHESVRRSPMEEVLFCVLQLQAGGRQRAGAALRRVASPPQKNNNNKTKAYSGFMRQHFGV